MSISVTGKLNEAAKEFPNQSGINFLVRLGVQVYDHKEKAKVWVNYSAFVFSNNDAQINFYRGALNKDAIIEVSGSGVLPEVYGDQNRVTLKIQDPSFGYIGFAGNAAPQQQVAPQQQAPAPQQAYQQAPAQQAPAQQAVPQATHYQAPPVDDGIPF